MTGSRRVVLVTGASGVVGRALVSDLQENFQVVALAHRTPPPDGVSECLAGDVRLPRLGLDDSTWRRLTRSVDAVVHSAAITEWGLPTVRYDDVNVTGTSNVLDFAQDADASFHFISSAFAGAAEHPDFDALVGPENVVRPYVVSKQAGERLVARSGLPANTYRLTNLIGHSATGVTSGVQIVQTLSSWLLRGRAPYYPAHHGNLIDLVPIDTASAAVVSDVVAGPGGHLRHVNIGPGALGVDHALGIVCDVAASGGREVARPPVVSPLDEPPVEPASLSSLVRRFLDVLTNVSEVTHASGGALPTTLVPPPGSSLHDLSDHAFRKSVRFWSDA